MLTESSGKSTLQKRRGVSEKCWLGYGHMQMQPGGVNIRESLDQVIRVADLASLVLCMLLCAIHVESVWLLWDYNMRC